MGVELIAMLFPLILKLISWGLNRTAMTDEQKLTFLQFVKLSEKSPQPSVVLYDMIGNAEKELEQKKKRALQ